MLGVAFGFGVACVVVCLCVVKPSSCFPNRKVVGTSVRGRFVTVSNSVPSFFFVFFCNTFRLYYTNVYFVVVPMADVMLQNSIKVSKFKERNSVAYWLSVFN